MIYDVKVISLSKGYAQEELDKRQSQGWRIAGPITVSSWGTPHPTQTIHIPIKRSYLRKYIHTHEYLRRLRRKPVHYSPNR